MKTSFTAFAVLAAVAASVPAFAQGNSFFDYQQLQPSRAQQEQLARQQRRETEPAYALTGNSARRTDQADKVTQHVTQVPGNGFTAVQVPTDR